MTRDITRLIRYDVATDTGEQVFHRHRWTFLIINQKTQIETIKQKLLEYFANSSDFSHDYDVVIPRSRGVRCLVVSFSTDVGELKKEDRSKIYASTNFKHDPNLSISRNYDGWREYVAGIIN